MMDERKPRKKTWLWVGIGVVVLVVIIAAASSAGGDKEATVATSATTAATVAQATMTSEEAPETTTTRRTTTTAVASDAAYRSSVLAITSQVGVALDKLSTLGRTFPAWTDHETMQYAAALVVLKMMKGDLNKLTPPASWRKAHAHLLNAGDYLGEAADLAAMGIDNLDGGQLSEAAAIIRQGNGEIEAATADIPE